MEKEAFFLHLQSKYKEASAGKEVMKKRILVGSLAVEFNFIGPELIDTFFKAFAHLESKKTITSSLLKVFLWDHESTHTAPINPLPWKLTDHHHLGLIESFTDQRYFTLQQPGSQALYMLDKKRKEAHYAVPSKKNIPHWESDFPLRMLFHWWLIDTPYQPVHAGAVGNDNGGILLVGKGGSGKSTSTLSCLQSNLKIAGDDYVLLDTEGIKAFSLFSLSKLTKKSVQLLDNPLIDVKALDDPIDDKYRIRLYPQFANQLIKEIPVKAIVLPQVVNGQKQNRFVPGSAGEAMIALAPTTLFQLPGLREESFQKMAGFVRKIPCYKLLLGQDTKKLPMDMEQFINSFEVPSG